MRQKVGKSQTKHDAYDIRRVPPTNLSEPVPGPARNSLIRGLDSWPLHTAVAEGPARCGLETPSIETSRPPTDKQTKSSATTLSDMMVNSESPLPTATTTSSLWTLPKFQSSTAKARTEQCALRPLQPLGDMRIVCKQKRLYPIRALFKDIAVGLSSARMTADSPHLAGGGGGKERPVSTLQALLGTPKFSPPFFTQTSTLIRGSNVLNESQVSTLRMRTKLAKTEVPTRQECESMEQVNDLQKRKLGVRLVNMKSRSEFMCAECEQTFVQKGRMFNHVRVVHERQRAYECPRRCGQTFGAKGDLTRHVRSIHEGRRPFHCNSCNAAFSRKSVLVRHCSKVHAKPPNVATVSQVEIMESGIGRRS